jgi:hypothetical protein
MADALSRAPLHRVEENLQVLLLSEFDSESPSVPLYRAMRVVPEEEVEKTRLLFDSFHNTMVIMVSSLR